MIETKKFFPLLLQKVAGLEETLWPYVEAYYRPQPKESLFNDKLWDEVMEELSPSPKPDFLEEVSFCGWLSSLVDYVLDLYSKDRDLPIIKEIMSFIEDAINKVNLEAKNEIEVCFFESIINGLGTDEEALKEFFKMLGPASLELCKQNDAFWGTRTPGLYESDH